MKNLKATSIIITVIMLSLVSKNSTAQNFYITAGLGYGFMAASQSLGDNYSYTSSGNTISESDQSVKGSFGSGLNFGGALGYMFGEHLGAEIGVSYLSGSTISSTSNTNFVTVSTTSISYSSSATMLRIIPSLKICGEPAKITPYIRVGLVLGISPTITTNSNETDTYTTGFGTTTDTTIAITNKFTGGISIGFSVALGADLKLSDKVSIFGEIGMIAQTWAPTQSNYSTWTKNGVDQLASMTTSQKQTDYLDNYSTTSTVPTNTGLPSQALKQYAPFSSWGFNVGLHFNFGGGTAEASAPKK
jgi:hypothetical protein